MSALYQNLSDATKRFPHKVIGDCVLFCADSLEILPTLGKVDAVVTDPPYGIGESDRKVASREQAAKPRDYGSFNWDEEPIGEAEIALMRACSRWQIIFGGNFFPLPPSPCWLVWDKQNSGDFADCELAWTNLPKAVRRIYWRWNGMIRKGSDERVHPTQKPLGVMAWCLDQLPADVETILDPYAGSGTTGIAAIRAGKRFIGIEQHEPYFDIACKRIRDEYARPRLALEPAPQPVQEGFEL